MKTTGRKYKALGQRKAVLDYITEHPKCTAQEIGDALHAQQRLYKRVGPSTETNRAQWATGVTRELIRTGRLTFERDEKRAFHFSAVVKAAAPAPKPTSQQMALSLPAAPRADLNPQVAEFLRQFPQSRYGDANEQDWLAIVVDKLRQATPVPIIMTTAELKSWIERRELVEHQRQQQQVPPGASAVMLMLPASTIRILERIAGSLETLVGHVLLGPRASLPALAPTVAYAPAPAPGFGAPAPVNGTHEPSKVPDLR